MRITEFSIRRHAAIVFLCLCFFLAGAYSYLAMPRESFPDVEFPFILVTTTLDGATPTDVEDSVTIPLETKLDGVEGLKEMRSVSSDGMSMISMEFVPGIEIDLALNRVRDAVAQAKSDISPDAEEPVVKEFAVTSIPVLIYHLVAGPTVSRSELFELAEKLEDDLKEIPGVLDVDIFGGRKREIAIEVDPERLHFFNLSLAQVQAILRGTNRNVSAGTADSATNRILMRVPGEFRNPAEIVGLVVGFTARGTPVYVSDVAMARYDFDEERSRARLYDFTGAPDRYVEPTKAVSLHIKKRMGENILAFCEDVAEVLHGWSIPSDVKIVKGLDQSREVRMMIGDLENGMGTAVILVLLVVLVGMGARNALLVATAIPLSMLITFIVLHMAGHTLNMMTLFSLILASGMLVDNAVVIIECIHRHHAMGLSRARAALAGTKEVARPVITSTATTVAAFLPLLWWPGIMGDFMSYLPMTVIICISSSLFVALVINPTLCAMFMKLKPGAEAAIDRETRRPTYWLVRKYQPALEFMLDRPGWTLATAAALLVFLAVLQGTAGTGVEFFPPLDPDNVVCSIKPPEGISVEASDRLSLAMEARMFGAPGSGYDRPVDNLKYASVVVGLEEGKGGALFQQNTGPVTAQVEFVESEDRARSSMLTLAEMRQRVEGLAPDGRRVAPPLFGAEFDVVKQQDGPPTGAPVSIDIFGEDLNQMRAVIDAMKRIMEGTPGAAKPTDDAVTAQPTLEWTVDRARAGIVGLEQATVASLLQVAVGGLKSGTIGHGDDEKDIMLRLPERYRLDTDLLAHVMIPVASGGSVPVASVASAKLVPGPVAIKHLNKQRILNASAEVQPGIRNDADVRAEFQRRVAEYRFPPGITHRFGGAAKDQEEASDFLRKAFVAALLLIFLTMMIEFNSFLVSGIVMCSVVLSVMGVLAGLLLLRMPFGIIMTGIGVISLAGIVVNNAIVLLDAVQRFEDRGETVRQAVVSATMVRFRPVLLTAVTTILGLLPMALKLNIDFAELSVQYNTTSSQWWQSMAVAVIFGLIAATVLTLGVVPALYLIYARAREAVRRGLELTGRTPREELDA
ncbi:MAG TPA: AcrB/AcrD/AcrF family protein [Planctomycetes bacterium]|nr:AcrB/AcrD/AcrF family protein [Planctomycetota bacterium]